MLKGKSKSSSQINTKLKSITIEINKNIYKKIWLFQPSLYEILIIDTNTPYPYNKISSENPIQYFTYILCEELKENYLVVVNSLGIWIIYAIKFNNKGIFVEEICHSNVENMDSKVIGIHLIQQSSLMLLFVKQNGKLQYNFFTNLKKQTKTLKINKLYEIQEPNNKYRKSNLFSKYQGRQLLEILNQNTITQSAFKINTKELLVVTEDTNSGVCSILRFFIQYYEVMTGMDLLLNLPAKPLEIIVLQKMIVINLGQKILVWTKNITQEIIMPQEGMVCTSLLLFDRQKQQLLGCFIKNNESSIYILLLNPQSNDSTNPVSCKPSKIVTISTSQSIIHYTPLQFPKIYPGIGINCKLEIISWDKDGKAKTILSNMQTNIISAILHQNKYSNYLKVTKKVGNSIQEKIVTNNRMVVEVDQYQHNMLIKMANCAKYVVNKDKAEIYFTSPIIGTLKLAVSISQDQKPNSESKVIISTGSTQPNLITEEQSLYFDFSSNQQITPTKLLTTKSKYNLPELFEGSIDSVLAGCIVGSYSLLLAEKQVHVFSLQPKPKRIHIYVFDTQVKQVIPLNSVNIWAALLWDGSIKILRIHEKQSIKINQIPYVDHFTTQNHFTFNVAINTAPHTFTITGGYLFICSNDPLHIYQPEKGTLQIIQLNSQEFGENFYPLVDLSQQKKTNEKYTILANIRSKWMILSFPTKYLIKNNDEIKVDVQQILAFPEVQNLIIGVIKDSMLVLISSSKIVTGTLYTGSITYKSINLSLSQSNPQQKSSTNLYHLRKWIKSQQISYDRITIESDNNLRSTHPTIIKMSQNRILLCGQKQIWYASIKNNMVKLISYFSMPNDAFIEFRNNLGIHELENVEFMETFAQKIPIFAVTKITEHLFAVLYGKIIALIQIQNNGALAIKQTLPFTQCPGLIYIDQFIGAYDQMSIYMKDSLHRLILLKYNPNTYKYTYQIKQQLEDQLVNINRVKGWKDRTRKVGIIKEEVNEYEEIRIKRDGQLAIGNDIRPIYI